MSGGSTKENLLGNGTLTVAARVMSVLGVPVATALIVFMGNEIWAEMKANRIERQTILVKLGAYEEKFVEIARRNDQQDVMIDRLRERGRP